MGTASGNKNHLVRDWGHPETTGFFLCWVTPLSAEMAFGGMDQNPRLTYPITALMRRGREKKGEIMRGPVSLALGEKSFTKNLVRFVFEMLFCPQMAPYGPEMDETR